MYMAEIELNKVMWLLVINPAHIYSNFALYILLDKFAKVTVSHNCQIHVNCVLLFLYSLFLTLVS